MSVRLRLLGVPALLRPGAAGAVEPRVLGRSDALLLALLAIDGPLPRSRAAMLVWPDHDHAARNLRQRVHQLKRLAGQDVLKGDPLLVLDERVQHDLPLVDSDLDAWLLADPAAVQGALLDGVVCAADDELAERLVQWRRHWDQRLQDAMHRCAPLAWAQGQAAVALALLQRLVACHPGDELAHRRLIELHHQLGDRSGALAAYDTLARWLQQSLGLQPAAETEALMRQVRGQGLPATPVATRPAAPALLQPQRLVGRERPWGAANQALEAGVPVLLTGEAGIGKTRLLSELAAARGGWPVVSARPGDADLPYALLARLLDRLLLRHGPPASAWVTGELARLVPGLGDADTEPFTVLRLQRAVRDALRGWASPQAQPRLLGLALDDLHFADAATLELLATLMGERGSEPAAADAADAGLPGCLMAARVDELLVAAPGWQTVVDDAGWCVLPLAGLDADGVRALLDQLPLGTQDTQTLAVQLGRLTAGNPLFMLQAVAALAAESHRDALVEATSPDGWGGGVRAWISRRIDRLSPEARQLLRLAAVAGDVFEPALADQVLDRPPLALADAWASLEAAQLLLEGQLAHDLVRQAALQGLPQVLIRNTHAQVAQALTVRGAAPAACARHWQAAQRWADAIVAWDNAALAAQARSASAEEVAALRAGLQCVAATAALAADGEGDGESERQAQQVRLGLRLVHALLRGYLPDQAQAELQALAALPKPPRQQLSWLLMQSKLNAEQQANEASLAHADEALALVAALAEAGAADAETLRLLAQQRRGMALMGLDRIDEALGCLPEAPAALTALGDEERLFWLSDRARLLDHADRRREAVDANLAVIAEAERQRRWLPAADACTNLAISYLYQGRLLDGCSITEQGLAYSLRAGADESSVLIDRMNLAANWRDLGWFDRYLASAETLPARLRAGGQGFWAPNAENDLAVAYSWLGRDDLARRLLSVMDDDLPEIFRATRLLTCLRLERDQGAQVLAPRPQDLIEQVDALLERVGHRSGLLRQALQLERAARQAPAAGAVLARSIADEALSAQNVMLGVAGLRLQVRLLLADGNSAGAAAAAEALLALYPGEAHPPSHYAPGLWWVMAQALATTQPGRAQALLRRAARWIHQSAAQVPALYQRSFVERNPVNRAVLAPPRTGA